MGALVALRSRSTIVPATRSPSRWLRGDSSEDTTAHKPPGGIRKSTMPTVERMKACRGAVGRALDGDDPEAERHLPG